MGNCQSSRLEPQFSSKRSSKIYPIAIVNKHEWLKRRVSQASITNKSSKSLLKISTECLVAHYMPPNFPISDGFTALDVERCRQSWELIVNPSIPPKITPIDAEASIDVTASAKITANNGSSLSPVSGLESLVDSLSKSTTTTQSITRSITKSIKHATKIVEFNDRLYSRLIEKDNKFSKIFYDIKSQSIILSKVINFILIQDSPEAVLNPKYEHVVKVHHDLDIPLDQFSSYMSSLVESLIETLGSKATKSMKTSWVRVCGYILRRMMTHLIKLKCESTI
jgi:hemoglobin-like flavoprotein